jgi:DNA-binding response OmpR family regulator
MTNRTATSSIPEVRVLVVDDEMHVRSALTRSLALAGYHADEAASGYQALQLLERGPYDVMLLDIRMPGMDGVEVMSRAHQSHPDLRIIILTGHATLESAIAAIKSHAADYLLKPASVHDIVAAVADVLRWDTREEPARTSPPELLLRAGPVTLNQGRHLVTVAGAADADPLTAALTVSESALLAHLMQHPDTVFSCRELAQAALGYHVTEGEARSIIRPHISRLRKKIEPDPGCPRLIRTVAGKGYLFSS